MSATHDKMRRELSAARRDYLRDMNWLRRKFGIIPTPHLHQVDPPLLAALDALESNEEAALKRAVTAFQNMHRAIMKEAVWHVLEQTKVSLKSIQSRDPELFAAKLERWNQASWFFTNFNAARSRTISGNYRKALKVLATL